VINKNYFDSDELFVLTHGAITLRVTNLKKIGLIIIALLYCDVTGRGNYPHRHNLIAYFSLVSILKYFSVL